MSWSALPVHQAYWPEAGVVYVVDVLAGGRFTLIACALAAVPSCAGSSWNVPFWPSSTSR
ncbi:hypothetical protein ACFQY4_34300 [Catellatospora bangladeshensis]|uniref:hypothetical protein n=1 Tax=Catellatospora bangladeshensis TaxID=310355 RepID=UPI003613A560